MKKYFLIVVFVSILINGLSQNNTKEFYGLPFNNETEKVEYTGIVNGKGKTKRELYSMVKNDLTLLLQNSKGKIIIDDAQNGKLAFQSMYKLKMRKQFLIFVNNHYYNSIYTINIDFKDNKYRYILTDYFVFDAEQSAYTSSSINWGYGISTSKLRENNIRLISVEKFFAGKSYRQEKRRIFPSFKQQNEEVVEYIKNIPSKKQKKSNW